MSKIPASVCANQAVTLDGIQSALIMLMGELYEHMDEGHDRRQRTTTAQAGAMACHGWPNPLPGFVMNCAR